MSHPPLPNSCPLGDDLPVPHSSLPLPLPVIRALFAWLFIVGAGEAPVAAAPPPPALENEALRVEVRAPGGELSVLDKRTGHRWTQSNVEADPARFTQRLVDIDLEARTLRFECDAPAEPREGRVAPARFLVDLALDAARPEISVAFAHDGRGEWRGARYPFVFALADQDARILYPHSGGMLVPVRKDSPDFIELPERAFYGGTRAYEACMGLLETETGGGLLTILDTVESAFARWPELTIGSSRVIAPQLSWRSSRYRFPKPFRIRWCFQANGGYVAMAERYREWFVGRGLHRTLEEKAQENPREEKLIGGLILWHCGSVAQGREVAEALAEDHVERALIALPAPPRLDSAGVLVPERDVPALVRRVEELGFLIDRYDQYRDSFAWDARKNALYQNNSDAFPQDVIHREDGSRLSPFGPASGVINPERALGYARKRLPEDLKRAPFDARFLDCVGSASFDVGEDWSADHPCDLYATRTAREDLLKYAHSLGPLLGAECGLDYTIPWIDWFEGPMTLVGFLPPAPPSSPGPSLDATARPAAAAPSDEAAWGVNLGTKYRVPFWALTHHDEAVSTWGWGDGMAGDAGHLQLGQWQRKNLWSILYGAIPIYRLYYADFLQCRPGIAQTARYVGDWARRIGRDAMISHRFVTPDHLVQETLFSSGAGVVVNFGATLHRMIDGQTIPPRSYRTFSGDPRRYEEPPVPEMDYTKLVPADNPSAAP